MQRQRITPRAEWKTRMEEIGFSFHSVGGTYWDESACYAFSVAEIDNLEAVTEELHRMCLTAVDHVVQHQCFARLAIPEDFWARITRSWEQRESSVYGRFDFCYDGVHPPKLLEYNADTPTSLLEASVAQWFWLQDAKPGMDQFNSIHEKLISRWQVIKATSNVSTLYFSAVGDSDEDVTTVDYLRDTAIQGGWSAEFIAIADIGWAESQRQFVDLRERPIRQLFKLYPWEWLLREEFGPYLLHDSMQLIEPYWKMLLSNKGILAILWELFPDHPNLLPTYFEPRRLPRGYVRKPLYSREGANIDITVAGAEASTAGIYGAEGYIYQAFSPLPMFDACYYPVVGSWVIGDQAAGIGVREDDTPITKNTSRFVPHYFNPMESSNV